MIFPCATPPHVQMLPSDGRPCTLLFMYRYVLWQPFQCLWSSCSVLNATTGGVRGHRGTLGPSGREGGREVPQELRPEKRERRTAGGHESRKGTYTPDIFIRAFRNVTAIVYIIYVHLVVYIIYVHLVRIIPVQAEVRSINLMLYSCFHLFTRL